MIEQAAGSANDATAGAEQVDVAIIGGGISGLATAWYILRPHPGLRVAVVEAGPMVGGKIAGATVAGHSVDCGPDAFLARVPGGVELATELGLGDDLVAPATGRAWVWSRGKLRPLPEGLVLGAPSRLGPLARSGILSPLGVARAALDEVWPRRTDTDAGDDPTVAAAISRHLGREVVERLVDPLLGGINASDCDRLSLASAAPNLVVGANAPRMMRALRAVGAAQQRGQIGVDQDRPVFLTPRTGVRSLIEELHRQLPDGSVRTGEAVNSLSKHDRQWEVTTSKGRLFAHIVVLATPAFITAGLVAGTSPTAAAELQAIRTSSVALTLLAYPADRISLPPGSGMLVPRVERRLVTASSWWNQKWPHLVTPGHVLVRASAGRDGDTRFTGMDDDELVRSLHQDLRDMLDIRANPVDAHVARWMDGFPQYESGHAARVSRIERALTNDAAGLLLAGASYNGIGLPACVRSAKAAAARAVLMESAEVDGRP